MIVLELDRTLTPCAPELDTVVLCTNARTPWQINTPGPGESITIELESCVLLPKRVDDFGASGVGIPG